MTKYNEDLLAFYKNKYLGYMTTDSANQVEVTDQGFVYKGELIVSLPGLRDMIVEKPKVTVGDLINSKKAEESKKEEPKKEELQVEIKQEEPVVETKAEEPKVEVPPAPKKRGPKPKKR